MDKIWTILESNPVLTMVLGFALAVLAMILFRSEIKAYIKKKYGLIEKKDIRNRLVNYYSEADSEIITRNIFDDEQ